MNVNNFKLKKKSYYGHVFDLVWNFQTTYLGMFNIKEMNFHFKTPERSLT